ncbi:MAG TPA: ABC transporter permease, partial [Terriglobales bacterium]|nr:ABC transporter permease [Terriglobales bacterium]
MATAMVAVLYPVLLPPLPYPHASQLVTISEPRGPVESFWGVAPPDFRDWQQQSHSFEQIAFYAYGRNVNLEQPGLTQIETIYSASENLFSTLGSAPAMGRGLVAQDAATHAQVAVLSDRVWRQAFGASPTVLGQVAKLGGKDYTIVGVLPPGFEFPYSGPADVWVPWVPGPDDGGRDASPLSVIARLKSGVSLRSAQIEMDGIEGRLGRQYASLHVPNHVVVRGYGDELTADVRPSVEAMGAGVALVWLIACASVAGLLLTRFAQRRRELAVRASLGATRKQLLQQMLAESLILGLLAGGAGVGIAKLGLAMLAQYVTAQLPLPLTLRLSPAVLLALVAMTLISVGLIGAVPALLAARGAGLADLRGSADVAGGRAQRRMHDALVVAEIALALALLAGAGLMLRTLQALGRVPLGFTTENVVSSSFLIPAGKFAKQNIETGF